MSKLAKQYLGSAGTLCLYFTYGYLSGIQGAARRSFINSSLLKDEELESWLLFSFVLTSFISQFTSGLLMDRYGRKPVLLSASVATLLACLLFYTADDYTTLLAGYVSAGLATAGLWTGPVMVAEICSPKYRPTILGTKLVFQFAGLVLVQLLSSYVHWRTLVLYGCIPSVCGVFSVVTSTESPAWLASKGRFRECSTSFHSLRSQEEASELQQLIKSQEASVKIAQNKSKTVVIKENLLYLIDKTFLRAVCLSIALVMCIELFGNQNFNIYSTIAKNALTDINFTDFDVIFEVIKLISLLLSIIIVSKCKIRSLVFHTGVPAVITLFLISLLLYSTSAGVIANNTKVIVSLLSFYTILIHIGISPILHILLSEIYPLSHRGIGVSVISIVQFLLTIASSRLNSSNETGFRAVLTIGIVISVILMYLFVYLPETSNRTLQDVEDSLNSKNVNIYKICSIVDQKDLILRSPYPSIECQLVNRECSSFTV